MTQDYSIYIYIYSEKKSWWLITVWSSKQGDSIDKSFMKLESPSETRLGVCCDQKMVAFSLKARWLPIMCLHQCWRHVGVQIVCSAMRWEQMLYIYIESEWGRKQEIICLLNSSRHQLLDLPCINDHIFPKHINADMSTRGTCLSKKAFSN